MSKKKIVNYPVSRYPGNITLNGRWFAKLEISQYYKTKKGRSMINDEVIRELVRQLHGKRFKRDENGYFSFNFLYLNHQAYNLVWDYDESPFNSTLLIINCYRESKYDKK